MPESIQVNSFVSPDTIVRELTTIVGTDAVCLYENLPQPQQQRVLQAVSPTTKMACIAYPQTVTELAELLTCADKNRWSCLCYGRGSKLNWGGVVAGAQFGVSTERLTHLVEHAVGDLTVTISAGMPFGQLQTILARSHQVLALDPEFPDRATLGGIVATADAGSLRHRYGGVRDMLIGLSFVRSDGKIAKAGGRVVKNVAGYDLMKLLTGSYGTLGILAQLTLRVYPIPEASQTVMLQGEAGTIAQATRTLLVSALTPTAVDLLSAQTCKNLHLDAHVGLMVRFQSLTASVQEQVTRLLSLAQNLGLSSQCYQEQDEVLLWQRLRELMEQDSPEPTITCKMGVKPVEAIAILTQISQAMPDHAIARFHASSGLGKLRLSRSELPVQTLLKIRQDCQLRGGFLSILQAPVALKQGLEVWGYSGHALDLMRKLKHQFDPNSLLNPHRFVGNL